MTEAAAISTPYYAWFCRLMEGFAIGLERWDDAGFFRQEYDFVTAAYNGRYLDTLGGNYSNGTVTANLLPLAFDMVPGGCKERVFASIIGKTMGDFGGHVSTGVVGIQHLMRTLSEYGRADLALHLATDTTWPSWGYMATHGATTIWELWNGDTGDPAMNSGNHVMLLGDLLIWYYECLGGIRALEPGYTKIGLKPIFVEGLDYVDCEYRSVSGKIGSHWHRHGDHIKWTVVVPPNTTAEVCLPTGTKTVGSGRHVFTLRQ